MQHQTINSFQKLKINRKIVPSEEATEMQNKKKKNCLTLEITKKQVACSTDNKALSYSFFYKHEYCFLCIHLAATKLVTI